MKICPNCTDGRLEPTGQSCSSCGWKSRNVEGVLDFFSSAQRSDGFDRSYNASYENLATIDLENSLVDRRFLARQARRLVNYIGDVSGASICEIGIGQGFFCAELLRMNIDRIVAVDVAVSYLKRFVTDPRVEPYLANAETLPFENEFDLIVSTDVMEHVINVGSFLYCLNRALVPQGRAVIRVPYREGLLSYSTFQGCPYRFAHVRSFNKDLLKVYFEQAGFRIRQFHLDGYSPFMPREWAMKTSFGRRLIQLLQLYVDRRFQHWADVGDLPEPILLSLLRPVEIVVVAEKVIDLREKYARAA